MKTLVNPRRSTLIAGTFAFASMPLPALAQFSVARHVIAGGGGESLGATFDLTGTVGQEAAGPTTGSMTGVTFSLVGEFWPVQRPSCPSDFNGDGFVNGDDFDAYVAAFELGDISADFNHDGFVTGEDFDSFAAAFEAGC